MTRHYRADCVTAVSNRDSACRRAFLPISRVSAALISFLFFMFLSPFLSCVICCGVFLGTLHHGLGLLLVRTDRVGMVSWVSMVP